MVLLLLRLISKPPSDALTECHVSHFTSMLFRHSMTLHCDEDNERKAQIRAGKKN